MTTTATAALSEDDQHLLAVQDRLNAEGNARHDARCQAAYGRSCAELSEHERARVWWAVAIAMRDLAGALLRVRAQLAEAEECGCQRFIAADADGGPALLSLCVAHACGRRPVPPAADTDRWDRGASVLTRDRLDEYAALLRAVVDHDRGDALTAPTS